VLAKVAVLLTILIAYCAVEVRSSELMYTTKACNECLAEGNIACRTARNVSVTACCDSNSKFARNCTATASPNLFDVCSVDVSDYFAEPFVCPYRFIDCNRDDHKISLNVATHVENEIVRVTSAGYDFRRE